MGPFEFQENNTIRIFEYPWAFYATPLTAGLQVLEMGGGLSGFQFILDKCGCRVINVAPGLEARGKGFHCDTETMAKLNSLFGTSVELRNTTLNKANLKNECFDRIYTISAVEHFADDEIEEAMIIAFDCLKPGGYFIATADLFLNLVPFTTRKENVFGKNVNIQQIAKAAPFIFTKGNREELYGYKEFNPDKIQSKLEGSLIGGYYPALSQCMVLQKPVNT
jgi:SAM-dependent methyltransferase